MRNTFSQVLTTGVPIRDEPTFFWKEKHYFGGDFKEYYGDLKQYLEHYPMCHSTFLRSADCTPMLSSPLAPIRIARTYANISPEINFIVTMRNPIDRLISEYHFMSTHFVKSRRFILWKDFDAYVEKHYDDISWDVHLRVREKHLNASLSHEEAANLFVPWLEAQMAMILSCMQIDGISKSELFPKCCQRGLCRSMYSSQLLHWFSIFDKSQFIVLPMRYYIEHPSEVLNRLGERFGFCPLLKKEEVDSQSLSPTSIISSSCHAVVINASHANKASQVVSGHDAYMKALINSTMLNTLKLFYKSFDEEILRMSKQENENIFWGVVRNGKEKMDYYEAMFNSLDSSINRILLAAS